MIIVPLLRYIWRTLPPGTVPLHFLIIIRTAFNSGNRTRSRTQIGINSVCNHRSDYLDCLEKNANWIVSNSHASCFSDVNECATGKHNCNGSSICHNIKGFFLCILCINCTGNILYIEIVDSADKKGRCVIAVCHMMKSLSLSSSLVSRIFSLFPW